MRQTFLINAAAELGRFEVVRFNAWPRRCRLDERMCCYAADEGHLGLLGWVLKVQSLSLDQGNRSIQLKIEALFQYVV